MREFTVVFDSVKDIAEFVLVANRQPFHVQIVHQDSVFDAKSLLSLFCLELHCPLTIRIPESSADTTQFRRDCAPYLVGSMPA